MKIEWLNEELTECIVTRGWFRKVRAHLKRDYSDRPVQVGVWRFVSTKRLLSRSSGLFFSDNSVSIENAIEKNRQAQLNRLNRLSDLEWVPVKPPEIPSARLVKKGT